MFLIIGVCILIVPGSAEVNPVYSCMVIDEPGNWVLQNVIVNSGESTCIHITVSDVIFDGGGYTIDGVYPTTSNTYGVRAGNLIPADYITNVTVRNVRVTEWEHGVNYYRTGSGRIENVEASGNKFGIDIGMLCQSITITRNTLNENYKGISLITSAIYNELTYNVANLNEYGIEISSPHNDLSHNTCNSNIYGICIVNGNNNTLINNTADFNTYYGIWVMGNCCNVITRGNMVENSDGIVLEGTDGNEVSLCSISNNTHFGANIRQNSNGNNITSNMIFNNDISGVNIVNSIENIIYNNKFNNNYWNGFDNSANFWSIDPISGPNIIGGPKIGGNYWAALDGSGHSQTCEVGSDGFCTNYYIIPGGSSTDWYPLGYIQMDTLSVPETIDFNNFSVGNNTISNLGLSYFTNEPSTSSITITVHGEWETHDPSPWMWHEENPEVHLVNPLNVWSFETNRFKTLVEEGDVILVDHDSLTDGEWSTDNWTVNQLIDPSDSPGNYRLILVFTATAGQI